MRSQLVALVAISLAWKCVAVGGQQEDVSHGEILDRGAGDVDECELKIADRCWQDVKSAFDCRFSQSPDASSNCSPSPAAAPNVTTLCTSILDALSCSSDIVDASDGSCVLKNTRDNFDLWIHALERVNSKLCVEQDLQLLLLHSSCWNLKTFYECLENELNLHHVVDLLTTTLNRAQCNFVMVAVSSCSERAFKDAGSGVNCSIPRNILTDLVSTFFTFSNCACADSQVASCPPSACPTPASMSSASSINFALASMSCLIMVRILLMTGVTQKWLSI